MAVQRLEGREVVEGKLVVAAPGCQRVVGESQDHQLREGLQMEQLPEVGQLVATGVELS